MDELLQKKACRGFSKHLGKCVCLCSCVCTRKSLLSQWPVSSLVSQSCPAWTSFHGHKGVSVRVTKHDPYTFGYYSHLLHVFTCTHKFCYVICTRAHTQTHPECTCQAKLDVFLDTNLSSGRRSPHPASHSKQPWSVSSILTEVLGL